MKVLVTGGAGYIGSTTCSALLDAGHTPVILDSLVNGRQEFVKDRIFYRGDISDPAILDQIFHDHPDIRYAIHFAALIVVPESVSNPYRYYRENVAKSNELFKLLLDHGCRNWIFSSSASVYGNAKEFMVRETTPLLPASPYARTKAMIEMIMEDMCAAYDARGIALRYFNPIGADPALRTGSYDRNPTHVLGKMLRVSAGLDPSFCVTGVDWPTRDGSGIRDYIHIWDLARAHVMALEKFDSVFSSGTPSFLPINLGTGQGVTVKELLHAFEEVLGRPLPTITAPPRDGDVAGAYANASRALELLGWKAEKSMAEAISDAIKWLEHRPTLLGY